MKAPGLYDVYRRLENIPFGRDVTSNFLRVAAPYFLTIPAKITVLEPGHGEARMPQRPWVRNHLGTVHAISLCNLAEFVMGAVAEATVPPSHRWVPRGMQVRYTALARGTMTARADLVLPDPLAAKQDVPVTITITDREEKVVAEATIDIYVTARAQAAP